MSSKIQRLKREIAYKGKLLEVYQDYMEIDGKESKWDFVHHKGGAAVVPVLDDGRIVLISQFRNAIDGDSLELPGGAFEAEGESGAICVARELEEETGYIAEKLEWLVSVHSMIAFCDEKVDIYVAYGLVKTEQHMDEGEDIEIVVLSIEEILKKLQSGQITDAKTVAGLFAYISQMSGI